MEQGFKRELVFNDGGVGKMREAQEVQGEFFKGLSDAVFFFYMCKKGQSPLGT